MSNQPRPPPRWSSCPSARPWCSSPTSRRWRRCRRRQATSGPDRRRAPGSSARCPSDWLRPSWPRACSVTPTAGGASTRPASSRSVLAPCSAVRRRNPGCSWWAGSSRAWAAERSWRAGWRCWRTSTRRAPPACTRPRCGGRASGSGSPRAPSWRPRSRSGRGGARRTSSPGSRRSSCWCRAGPGCGSRRPPGPGGSTGSAWSCSRPRRPPSSRRSPRAATGSTAPPSRSSS